MFFPIALALLLLTGCSRSLRPGQSDVPPGLKARPGVFSDINPRWSHDGKRIAFLRATPDRKVQLHIIDYALTTSLGQPQALLAAELLCPDRPYSPALQRYNSPDTLAWSPHDRSIAFERLEWFILGENERLPGTGLWSCDTTTHNVQPLAAHSSAYKDLFYYYHAPQWSPDGRYFAFVGEGINGQRVIFVRPLQQNTKEVMPRFDNYSLNAKFCRQGMQRALIIVFPKQRGADNPEPRLWILHCKRRCGAQKNALPLPFRDSPDQRHRVLT